MRCIDLKVLVRFFTVLREIAGKKEDLLEFPYEDKVTIETVINELVRRYGDKFKEYLYDDRTGNVRDFLQFLVNGRSASTLHGLKTTLKDGDILAIIPPVGGG